MSTAGVGLLTITLKLIGTGTAKILATIAALAITGVWIYSHQQKQFAQQLASVPETNSSVLVAKADPVPEPQPEPPQPQVLASSASMQSSNRLDLLILAADIGKPVPNVRIDYRSWQKGRFKGQQLSADRMGLCKVPIPQEGLTELELTTRTDGFADTRLLWRPDRGEKIPDSYTLRVVRPVLIGGLVVDADGQPVAGAKVGFNHEDDPTSRTLPESHEFSWIEVNTDSEGHWSINRIAPEMIRRIYGGATHPEHVGSAFIWTSRDAKAEKELRAGTYTFRLGQAVTVRGIVINPEGEPVPGAKVLVGMRNMGGRREAKTGADGTFEAKGCPPGTNLLSAEAPGFSATTTQVLVTAESGPFTLILARGAVLRMRVVSRAGEPVPNASLMLDTMHQRPINAPDFGKIEVQASFNKKTDADGRVVWGNAPNSELDFDIAASGYMRTNEVKVRPDGQEHVIVLAPALVISGTVRDADTGESIPRFRIITGWPQNRWGLSPNQNGTPASSVYGQWPTIGRFWVDYSGGTFRHVLEEPAIVGMANPGYMLKFEADDYAPFISRVIAPDEGNIQMDVTLNRSSATEITVLLPDGTPAAGADIGLVTPGAQLQLTPGGFSRQGGSSGTALLRADANGHFRLSGDPAMSRVITAHPAGYSEATPAALTQNSTLVVQPWGRLEGTYLSGGQAVSGGELLLAFQNEEPMAIGFDFMSFKVPTDAEGHFVFPKAPPGKLKLIRLAHVPPNGFTHVPVPNGDVEIRAGETTTKVFGATGYTVKAHARWPEDAKPGKGWHFFASLATSPPPGLLAAAQAAQAADDSATLAALQDSPEAKNYAARQIQAGVSDDYTITAENVPPGNYMFSATAFPETNGGDEMRVAMAGYSSNITVPTDPPSGTLDAGEIILSRPRLADSK